MEDEILVLEENNEKLKVFIELDSAIHAQLNKIERGDKANESLANVEQLLTAYQDFIIGNTDIIEQRINPTTTTNRVVDVLEKVKN